MYQEYAEGFVQRCRERGRSPEKTAGAGGKLLGLSDSALTRISPAAARARASGVNYITLGSTELPVMRSAPQQALWQARQAMHGKTDPLAQKKPLSVLTQQTNKRPHEYW